MTDSTPPNPIYPPFPPFPPFPPYPAAVVVQMPVCPECCGNHSPAANEHAPSENFLEPNVRVAQPQLSTTRILDEAFSDIEVIRGILVLLQGLSTREHGKRAHENKLEALDDIQEFMRSWSASLDAMEFVPDERQRARSLQSHIQYLIDDLNRRGMAISEIDTNHWHALKRMIHALAVKLPRAESHL